MTVALTPEQLFEQNRRLVGMICEPLRAAARKARIEYADMDQLGLLGLWHAARRFDPMRGLKFSTYATVCIRGQILQGMNRYRFGRGSEVCGRVDHAAVLLCGNDADEGTTMEQIGGSSYRNDVVEESAHREKLEILRRCIDSLPERWRQAITMSLDGRILRDMAKAWGGSKQRASLIRRKAESELERLVHAAMRSELAA